MGCTFSTPCPQPIKPSCDGIRETPLRLLGYGTHVGTACSSIIPCNLVHLPNMITTAYVTADIFNKGYQTSVAGKSRKMIFVNMLDALIWQSLATIILPGLIIERVKDFAIKSTKPSGGTCPPTPPRIKLPGNLLRAFPCMLGVLTLPLIMYPIDKAVTLLMDYTYRPIFKESEPSENEKKAKAKAKPKEAKPEAKPKPKPQPPVKKEQVQKGAA